MFYFIKSLKKKLITIKKKEKLYYKKILYYSTDKNEITEAKIPTYMSIKENTQTNVNNVNANNVNVNNANVDNANETNENVFLNFDADVDTDTDADADVDTDTDADVDTDTNAYAEADSDTDMNFSYRLNKYIKKDFSDIDSILDIYTQNEDYTQDKRCEDYFIDNLSIYSKM